MPQPSYTCGQGGPDGRESMAGEFLVRSMVVLVTSCYNVTDFLEASVTHSGDNKKDVQGLSIA